MIARHTGLAGLTITEFNPDHGAEDGSTTDKLVRGLGVLTREVGDGLVDG